ncbi:MAG: phosphoribosylanthranilate isomerase [Thermoleophilia bacterium]|nr:phosphoribosylanthranilate isomerase [Thermoleophilia bacterium]
MTLVKICGMTRPEDVAAAVAAGADRLGFVVEYPQDNPWNLTRERARDVMDAVPQRVLRVAVVGGGADAILEIVGNLAPDMVQIHDDGPAAVVAAVAAAGVPVVKALRIDVDAPDPDPAHWIALGRAYAAAGAAELLVDSKSSARPAGTGVAVDRAFVRRVADGVPVPVVLAGGLTPANVATAVREVRPAVVDVISGVEGPGHTKDPALMAAFVSAARDA